jgi:hypothetical protein
MLPGRRQNIKGFFITFFDVFFAHSRAHSLKRRCPSKRPFHRASSSGLPDITLKLRLWTEIYIALSL